MAEYRLGFGEKETRALELGGVPADPSGEGGPSQA